MVGGRAGGAWNFILSIYPCAWRIFDWGIFDEKIFGKYVNIIEYLDISILVYFLQDLHLPSHWEIKFPMEKLQPFQPGQNNNKGQSDPDNSILKFS